MELTVEYGTPILSEVRGMPAATYRSFHVLVQRSDSPLFLPIRALQVLAILEHHEITFLHQDNKQQALLRWAHFRPQDRLDLQSPVYFEGHYYLPEGVELKIRIPAEFERALAQLEEKSTIRSLTPYVSPFPLKK
ncbi:hypothetical protein [Ferrovum myxofaciens]|jgi:hypothetical protein|uniref:Uncharacterized protein n=2 Tax=root TaxID=1 RepID=A0A8F3DX47_9PROT|nr:hypothetical protein [Ferrovum myxofaciens]NDU89079.1 hypothetical protein [Ferrovum sp.]KXW58804.1 hypothetical protein FEMY_06820 [Ferrovum myxofaciens]MBU6995718.1 hypothetical protein [Ferrovum myxofaciens]QKE39509.1 MAG: hypothetical protein HO273_12930 [Ferrovum myxofaciens]QWY74788.1 MAG: hypothetical protein JVY19_13495 [Ferrovum myxofaciens]